MDKQIVVWDIYSATNMNELLMHATAWMDFRIIMLSVKGQANKPYTFYDPIYRKF